MADPRKSPSRIATIVLTLVALGVAAVNAWPHPRGIYGTDFGWPLILATFGPASNFDLLALIVDLLLAIDVLVFAGSILIPPFRKVALFWLPVVMIQLVLAALFGLMLLFIHR